MNSRHRLVKEFTGEKVMNLLLRAFELMKEQNLPDKDLLATCRGG